MGATIPANLQKLRSLLKKGWQITAIAMEYQKEEWKSIAVLKRGKSELTLQCDDQEFAHFCHSTKEFFDIEGKRMFRQVTDIGRYHNELMPLTIGFEEGSKKAFERLKAGQIHLTFEPAALIRDFLQSRAEYRTNRRCDRGQSWTGKKIKPKSWIRQPPYANA